MKILFLTALKAEAQPLISTYRLQKDSTTHLYSHTHIDLLITGVGAVKTTERLNHYLKQNPDLSQTVVVNVGIAGGNPDQTEIGVLYRANAIQDESDRRYFFPDILLRHGQKEISLTTVSKGITENGERYPGLVDMEGSAIFKIMSTTVPPHRLIFLKVVSDLMNVRDWKSLDVTGLIQNKVDEIQSIVESYHNEVLGDRQIFSSSELAFLNQGIAQLKLTKTQQIQLLEWSESFKKRNGESIELLKPLFTAAPKSKAERNGIHEEIRQKLSA